MEGVMRGTYPHAYHEVKEEGSGKGKVPVARQNVADPADNLSAFYAVDTSYAANTLIQANSVEPG